MTPPPHGLCRLPAAREHVSVLQRCLQADNREHVSVLQGCLQADIREHVSVLRVAYR